jgi:hypothetical protein
MTTTATLARAVQSQPSGTAGLGEIAKARPTGATNRPSRSPGTRRAEAGVLGNGVVDTDVAVVSEEREDHDHLGHGEVLSDAAARSEPEWKQRPARLTVGVKVAVGIESLWIGPCLGPSVGRSQERVVHVTLVSRSRAARVLATVERSDVTSYKIAGHPAQNRGRHQ